MQGSF